MTTDQPIPDDVMREASKWTAEVYQQETLTWFDVRDVIARALLAERQRAAEIARAAWNRRAHPVRVKASGMSYGALRAISAAGRSLASSLNRINHTLDVIESGSIVITSKRRRMRNMASGHDAISLCDEIYSLPVTIERFCVISGISRPTVSGWMRGRRPKPFMMEVARDAINQIKAGRR